MMDGFTFPTLKYRLSNDYLVESQKLFISSWECLSMGASLIKASLEAITLT